ncbi:MAG: hypothetical protein M3332_13105, partial [Actinomycetota bacterium]|nr:hypothetical protein [Actinomycetota bacterium]
MANILPAQSSDLEGAGTGNWAVWYNVTISKTTTDAFNGTGSLRIEATASDSLGVQSDNWPGYSTGVTANQEYEISYYIKGPAQTWTLTGRWR